MKNRILIALIAVFCLLIPTAALADGATGLGERIVANDILAAYTDGNGHLMIAGNDVPVTRTRADSVISVDPYRIVFLSEDNAGKHALICLNLSDNRENILADNVRAACMAENDRLYFVTNEDRTTLKTADFENDSISVVYTASEEIDRLFMTAEGLVATYVENAGAVIASGATGMFESYAGDIPSENLLTADYQLYIAGGSDLYLFRTSASAAVSITSPIWEVLSV